MDIGGTFMLQLPEPRKRTVLFKVHMRKKTELLVVPKLVTSWFTYKSISNKPPESLELSSVHFPGIFEHFSRVQIATSDIIFDFPLE